MIQLLVLVGLLVLSGFSAPLLAPVDSFASLVYTHVGIEAIDAAAPSLTFKTADGDVWTLQVTSVELLKGLRKGDTCSVEIDMDNRVTKIVKVGSTPP
ncbi:MAG: hypothetical protein H8K10_13540 [Nitrospira sp.]|nr:hypothetical protein [Nitrospira sp.]